MRRGEVGERDVPSVITLDKGAVGSGPTKLVDRLRPHWIGVVGWLWAAVYLLSTRTQPLRLNWGDPWSDSHIQQHGRYFAEYGFIRNSFIAVTDIGPLRPDSLKYTHYPPLPDIINGIEQRLLGPSEISTYRLFADLFTLGSLYFFYRWAAALFGRMTAGVALVLMTTSVIWLQYADTIHHIPIYWLFGSITLFLSHRWVRERRRSTLWMASASTLLCDMASYDWFFFVPVLVAVTIWMSGGRLRDRSYWPLLLAVGGGVVGAVVVKHALVAWAVGPREMIHDFIFQLEERATATHSTDYKGAFWLFVFHRSVRFFSPLVFAFLAIHLASLGLRLFKRSTPHLPPPTPLLVLCAGVPFVGLFSQLLVEQYHPTLQFVPYYAIAGGSIVAWLWSRGRAHLRALAIALVVLPVGWEMRELARFEKVFLERDAVKTIARYLDANDRQPVVYTNTIIDAPFRFYFQRHGLSVAGLPRESISLVLEHAFTDYGDEPVHFVEFSDVDKAAFDKGLYALFAAKGAWTWIADPYAHRSEWEASVRDRDRAAIQLFEQMGTVVVEAGRMRLIRVSPADLEAYLGRCIGESKTRSIAFGDPSSACHKLKGFRYSERYGNDDPGFSWTMERQRKHPRFTMKGLELDPHGPIEREAVVLVRTHAGARVSFRALAAVDEQRVDVTLNGRVLATVDLPREFTDFSVDLPEDALDPSGLQRVAFRWAKSSEYGFGLALQSLRVE